MQPSSTTQYQPSSPGWAAIEIDQQPNGKGSVPAAITGILSYQHAGLSVVMKDGCNRLRRWEILERCYGYLGRRQQEGWITIWMQLNKMTRGLTSLARGVFTTMDIMYSSQITKQPFWTWMIMVMRRQPRIQQWHNDTTTPFGSMWSPIPNLVGYDFSLLSSLEIYPRYHVFCIPRFPLNEGFSIISISHFHLTCARSGSRGHVLDWWWFGEVG